MSVLVDIDTVVREWLKEPLNRVRYRRAYWSVVCFHEALQPDLLRSFIRQVSLGHELVGLEQGLAMLSGGDFKRPLLTITYDDSDQSVYEYALPVHLELGAPAMLYVATKLVDDGRRYPTGQEPRQTMTWKQIEEWHRAGLEVGAHTVNHIPLNQATLGRAQEEVLLSIQILEEQLGAKVRHFAYPWGLYTDSLARSLGCEA